MEVCGAGFVCRRKAIDCAACHIQQKLLFFAGIVCTPSSDRIFPFVLCSFITARRHNRRAHCVNDNTFFNHHPRIHLRHSRLSSVIPAQAGMTARDAPLEFALCASYESSFGGLGLGASNKPNSNNSQQGIAKSNWDITSGGVRIAAITNAPTIMYGRLFLVGLLLLHRFLPKAIPLPVFQMPRRMPKIMPRRMPKTR